VRCALPLDAVIETMRLLPVEPIASAPRAVLGVAIIRGAPVPVVDLGWVIAGRPSAAGRLVTIRVADRTVALAVDGVDGVHRLDMAEAPPPLLAGAEAIADLAAADGALMVVLQTTKILPAGVP
jgi:purine-binding chemotaxis protein CheW